MLQFGNHMASRPGLLLMPNKRQPEPEPASTVESSMISRISAKTDIELGRP
jgi:hypothetical protein